MEIQKTLGLKTPDRTSTSSSTFLASPKEIESWIESLPTANVGETSRQVFKTLVEFNRVEIPNLARIKIAEIFRQPIDYIATNLRKYYYDVPLPLSPKNRKIAVLNRELYAELAVAYKIFIEMMVSGKGGKFDRKLLVIAIHRALRYLGLVNYQAAIVYDPFPTDIWREINRLYAFAEQNGIDQIQVKEGLVKSHTCTISDVYRQNLLFAILSPFRHRQREIQHIYKMLPIWAEKLSLQEHSSDSRTGTEFHLDLSDDQPPVHRDLREGKLTPLSRIISSGDLVEFLRADFDEIPANSRAIDQSSQQGTSKGLLRQLIQTLSSAPKREFVRTRLNFELKTAVGINAIHALLSRTPEVDVQEIPPDDDDLDWFEQQEAKPPQYTHSQQKLSIFGSTPVTEETVLSGYHGASNMKYPQAPTWTTNQQSSETVIETFPCKTLNESAGGYCIHWHGNNIPRVRVGEIFGIQSATNRNQFGIGITRWLKNSPGAGLQLGMEVISPGSLPVQIRSATQEHTADTPHKGLLLPELKSSGKTASLIVGPMLFTVGDNLLLESGGNQSRIRLTRLLESSGAFNQFQFIYQSGKDIKQTDSNEKDEDFDNIWSMI